MKRIKPKMIVILFSFCLTLIFCTVSKAEVSTSIPMAIQDGRFVSEHSLQKVIDMYFKSRSDDFSKQNSLDLMNENHYEIKLDNNIIEEKENRIREINKIQTDNDMTFNSAESLPYIKNGFMYENQVYLEVYEWTWIDYQSYDADEIDRMGFATDHIIIVEDVNNEYKIIKDIYDEGLITGVNTLDEDYLYKISSTDSLFSTESKEQVNHKSYSPNSNSNYNVLTATTYADRWVVKDRSSNLMNPQSYNPAYYYYSSDCANYVSQCLYEGGMATDSNWWVEKNNTSKVTMDNNYTKTPIAWRSVNYFAKYWKGKGYSDVSANENNIYPGNPVYHLNNDGSGHLVMCVGYNSAGVPIVNGHNRDVYHVPYNLATSSNRRTIQIVTSNKFMNKPQYAHNFGVISSTTPKTTVGSLTFPGEVDYFKFEIQTAGNYTMYTEYNGASYLDTFGVLYQESAPAPSGSATLYMVEIVSDDDGGEGINFKINRYLSPGTYYIGVNAASHLQTGNYTVKINKR